MSVLSALKYSAHFACGLPIQNTENHKQDLFANLVNIFFEVRHKSLLQNPCYLLVFFGSSLSLKFVIIPQPYYLGLVIIGTKIFETLTLNFFFDYHRI